MIVSICLTGTDDSYPNMWRAARAMHFEDVTEIGPVFDAALGGVALIALERAGGHSVQVPVFRVPAGKEAKALDVLGAKILEASLDAGFYQRPIKIMLGREELEALL